MKPACIDALTRIFSLSDRDRNGYLSDQELNDFQRKCFGQPLQHMELEGIKNTGLFLHCLSSVNQGDPTFSSVLGLSLPGFLYLNTIFIQKGRMETTWRILRSFGYGDDLVLAQDFLVPLSSLSKGGAVELSRDGYAFFTELFQSFDVDKDGALNIKELSALFSTSPGNPWTDSGFPNSTITNASDAVTLQGFLAQWSMTTLFDYTITLAYLAYLGYPGDQTSALKRVAEAEKSVFMCLVFGGTGSGKTCLLRALVDKAFDEGYKPTSGKSVVVNSVEIHGGERYLVMQEFGPLVDGEILDAKGGLEAADLVCLAYDCGDVNSFSYVAELYVYLTWR